MPKSLKHHFVSAISDGTDATLVRPSNWNADHDFYEGYRSVTGTTDTIADSDNMSTVVYTSATAPTISLPAPAGGAMASGWRVRIQCTGAAGGTVTGTGGATINGLASTTIKAGDALDIHSTGAANYIGVYHPASGGASTLAINLVPFTASGTYNPSPGIIGAIVELVGGGAGGGGCVGPGSGFWNQGGGGGSGGYSRRWLTAAQIGASQAVTIGARGNGGGAGNAGGAGGTTSFGALVVANGGSGGPASDGTSTNTGVGGGGAGGAVGTGDIAVPGNPGGGYGWGSTSYTALVTPNGGSSAWGGAGRATANWAGVTTGAAAAAGGYGCGGAGGTSMVIGTGAPGGNGVAGACFVMEFLAAAPPVSPSAPAPSLAMVNSGILKFVSTTALSFLPFGGNQIVINGSIYTIPSTGNGIAGLANTAVYVNGVSGQNLAANTLYYVYAFNNAGTITADFSTTGHSTSGTAGNQGTEIKTGDDTRSLIGMIRTSGTIFAANLVLSWFNRRRQTSRTVGSTALSTSSAYPTYVEFSSAFRAAFLMWAGDQPDLRYNGSAYSSAISFWYLDLRYDATGFSCQMTSCSAAATYSGDAGMGGHPPGLAEGYHQLMLYGSAQSGQTTTVNDPSNAPGILEATVMG